MGASSSDVMLKKIAVGAGRVLCVGVVLAEVDAEVCVATVTVQVAYKPLCVVAMMVALPTETAVTVPLADTVAMLGLELDHATTCDALEGMMVADRL